MRLMIFLVLSVMALPATAKVFDARIDSNTNELVFKFEKHDCNTTRFQLVYLFSGRASFGPHHYELVPSTTKMWCPYEKPQIIEVRLKLPSLGAGDQLRIRTSSGLVSHTINTDPPVVTPPESNSLPEGVR